MKKGFSLKKLKLDKQGLIPAIIQDYRSGEVLMLAYMNIFSLKRTLKTGKTCFWSRSRKVYWIKGATSGNYQLVKSVAYDCDMDALLIKVRQSGVACHTGNRSCFYRKIDYKL
ncbi:MAG: phosphoribosyl-AMP cyclohydrolase [Candidatus Omnitrophica bacterium]|nr:phosphoribosyl-AMP cyclohydrolase [Candidatus Omnitrophota bacterium]MDD5591817.1 phosphoribosyl-AMP cyclohydrolase [Candidatus Omnitrophota bacterium]